MLRKWNFDARTTNRRPAQPPTRPSADVHHFNNLRLENLFKNQPKLTQICSYGIYFQRTQERVRNIRGKRAVRVRATEVLLYK